MWRLRLSVRVLSVRGVTNKIVVNPDLLGVRTDAAIEADVRIALVLDTLVPLAASRSTTAS